MRRNGRSLFGVAVATVALVVASAVPSSAASGFVDVRGDEFFGPSVEWMRQSGLTTGVGGTTSAPSPYFRPFDTVDRAQFVTFLWRMAGSPAASPGVPRFEDVPAGAYYAEAVTFLREFGVVQGVAGTNRFEPHRPVTRAETVTVLWRAAQYYLIWEDYELGGLPLVRALFPHGFVDVQPGSFYELPVYFAWAFGLTTGVGGTPDRPSDRFVPLGELTRGEAATLLHRFFLLLTSL